MAPSAEHPVPGDPDRVEDIARRLGRVAEDVGHVRTNITAREVEGWRGPACDAFRTTLGELPDKLTRVEQSYDLASSALHRYASDLRDAQQRHRAATHEQHTHEADAAAQDALKRDARRRMLAAEQARASAQDPATHSHYSARATRAASDAAMADMRARNAREASAAAGRRAQSAHGDWQAAVERCEAELGRASHAGIRNSLGTAYERYIERGVLPAIGEFGEDLKALGDAALEQLKEVLRHPAFEWLSDALGTITTALAVVGAGLFVAALVISPTGPVAAAVGAAAAWVAVAAITLGAAKALIDGGRLWAGAEDDPTEFMFSLLGIIPGVRGALKGAPVVKATSPALGRFAKEHAKYLMTGRHGYVRGLRDLGHELHRVGPPVVRPDRWDGFFSGLDAGWSVGSQFSTGADARRPICPDPATAHRLSSLQVVHAVPPPTLKVAPPSPTGRIVVE